MKTFFSILTLFLISFTVTAQSSDLYFSMAGEGSSDNRFLEIYNGTGASVNLSAYSISICKGGCDVFGEFDYPSVITFASGTMLSNGDVYIIAHPDADAAILAEADMTFDDLSNGDDAVALTVSGATAANYTIIDIIGDLQGDPGDGWDVAGETEATKNSTLIRQSAICDPNATPLSSFGTNATNSEWLVFPKDSKWDDLGTHSGCLGEPAISITSPKEGKSYNAQTSIDLSFVVENFSVGNPGSVDGHIHWTLNSVSQQMVYTTDPIEVTVVPGGTYTVFLELVDNSHASFNPAISSTVTFTVDYPCDLELGTISTTCNSETSGTDNYTASIDFTGGGTSTYTIDTEGAGSISGDNPSNVASGTILVQNIAEGTDFEITIEGDAGSSTCDLSEEIVGPNCISNCEAEGSIIITEIMQNPSLNADPNGEYFEVYNTTASSINMNGWVISDDGANTHTISSSLVVLAGGYAVLGNAATPNGDVSLDYAYTDIKFGNDKDGVIIRCSSNIIDQVIWDGGDTFPDPSGASMELSITKYNASDNDNGSYWGEAVSAYGLGDLGTPGLINDFTTLSVAHNTIENFSVFPNPVTEQHFFIKTASANTVKTIQIYTLLGEKAYASKTTSGKINISNLSTGIYILKVEENGKSAIKKLIIE